jgi:hypothetical protein
MCTVSSTGYASAPFQAFHLVPDSSGVSWHLAFFQPDEPDLAQITVLFEFFLIR